MRMEVAGRSVLVRGLEESRQHDNDNPWLGLSGPLPDYEQLWDSADWTSESTMNEDGAGLMLWADTGTSSDTTDQDDVIGPVLWDEIGSSSGATDEDGGDAFSLVGFGSDKGESGSELATTLDESPAGLLRVAAADSGGRRSDRWLPNDHQSTAGQLSPTTSVEPQRLAAWMPTQGEPAWAQIVIKEETPVPAATLPTTGAQKEETRTVQPSGAPAAQNEDVEAPRPATARHLPRHHPLVGLAGKLQGATDEPLVCPLCNRGCEEHHRLGFHCEYPHGLRFSLMQRLAG